MKKTFALILAVLALFAALALPVGAYMYPYESSATTGGMKIVCSPLDKNTRTIPVYSSASMTSRTGYIYGTDNVTILGMSGKTLYVEYPGSGGVMRRGYCEQKYFSKADLNGGYSLAMKATTGNLTVYKYATGSETRGTVFTGETFYLVFFPADRQNGLARAQIIYEAAAGWKMGFVTLRDFETCGHCRAVGCSQTIPDGTYVLRLGNGNYAVDGDGDRLARDVAQCHVWSRIANLPAQTVTVKHLGNGQYRITFGNGLVLDQQYATMDTSTLVAQTWNGGDNQKWYIFYGGDGRWVIFNVNSGLALDVCNYDFNNGTDILAWFYNGQSVQITTTDGRVVTPTSAAPVLEAAPTTPSGTSENLSTALYKNSNAKITCKFDGYTTTKGRHEGIDFSLSNGSPVYALTDGVITRVASGYRGRDGLSTIAVYNEATNKTVIYLHSAPLSNLKAGMTISRGQQIATQDWRGVSSSDSGHTHVEVRNGYVKNAAYSVNDYVLENSDPTPFWNAMGYKVK